MTTKNYIKFIDVTNRDGVQTSRLGLAKLQKTIINLMLNDLGVYISEFGFPTTGHEVNYLNGNLQLASMGAFDKTKLSGWVRAVKTDVQRAIQNVPKLVLKIKSFYILIIIASLFSLVVEHSLSKREVIGSTPVGGLYFLFYYYFN